VRRLALATTLQSPLPQHYNSRLSGNKCHVFIIASRVTCINADLVSLWLSNGVLIWNIVNMFVHTHNMNIGCIYYRESQYRFISIIIICIIVLLLLLSLSSLSSSSSSSLILLIYYYYTIVEPRNAAAFMLEFRCL